MTVFDIRELSELVEPAASAGYLVDWFTARGWDTCNLAGPNQSDIGHWQGTGSVDPLTGQQPEDVLAALGETLPSWITGFLFNELNVGAGDHVDVTDAIDAFDPDVVVVESAAQTWAFTLVVEWYTAWQEHGGSLPSGTSYQDVDNTVAEMLAHLPAWPGSGSFLDHVDEVAASRLTTMAEAYADAMETPAEDRQIIWLTRPPVDTDAVSDPGDPPIISAVNAGVNAGFYGPIYAGTNRTLTNEIDGISFGTPSTGEVNVDVVGLGIDNAGAVRRIDPVSQRDQYLTTGDAGSYLDGHHLSDWGGWRAAHSLCLALDDGYLADSGIERCHHLNEVSRVLQPDPWTDTSPEPAFEWVYTYRLMNGTAPTTFTPGDVINRGQAARLAYRMRGEPDPTGLTEPWSDISTSTNSWLLPTATWLASTSPAVMTGYTDAPCSVSSPCFRPGKPMTRGEAVRMAYRFAGEPAVGGLTANTFVDVPNWLDNAVTWATNSWPTVGQFLPPVGSTRYQPNEEIRRDDFVRMLHRLASTSTAWDTDVPVIWSQQFS